MISKLRRIIARNLVNIRGWQTDRKIVVLESDDWGSIRMPSKEIYNKFLNNGIPVNKNQYCKYDSLASEDDLNALFETLTKFKDSQGNHPVITANTLVANPDFEKIKASNFTDYYYEKFTDTLKRYKECQNSFNLWMEGYRAGLFYPQFHGREHLNVPLWLNLLNDNHVVLKHAFEHNFWGLGKTVLTDISKNIQAAYDGTSKKEIEYQKNSISDGLKLFQELFGYNSKSFIASNYIWSPELEKILAQLGVEFIQGMKYQILPHCSNKKPNMIRHYLGDQNEFNQTYLIRNCFFEPSLKDQNHDDVRECLKDVANAFLWNKPAVITTHRLNFIGSKIPENRKQNLKKLSNLLGEILNLWPQSEFLTSCELGDVIKKSRKEDASVDFLKYVS